MGKLVRKGKTSLALNETRDDGVFGCSCISWTICKQSAPCSRQITTSTPRHSIFTGRMLFLMPSQQCQSTEGTLSVTVEWILSPCLLICYSVPGCHIVMSISICVCVLLSVCVHISRTARPIITKFVCMLPVDMAQSFSYGVAIPYVFMV